MREKLDGLNVCDITVRAQDVAKDLGMLLDSQMTMIKLQTCARYLYCIVEISQKLEYICRLQL